MPRFTQDQPFDSELNKNSQDSLRQNLLSNIENVSPVDGVILPGGDIGIIKSENVIIPIKKDYDYAGTINQDGFLAININANADKCLVNIDGQPSYRTTPTKFVFSISDIIGVGTKTISLTKEGYESNEQYNISIVQNPNFIDDGFSNYRNTITNYDGVLGLQPEQKIFTKSTPYVFRIERVINGEVVSTDASDSPNDIKELLFELKKQNPKDNAKIIVPEVSTYNVTINLKGPNNSVNLTNVNTSENIKLTNEVTTFIVETGTNLQIVSVNNNLYKISKITATSQGLKPRVLEALNTDTLFSEYTVDNNTVIDIESENITIVQQASNPVIRLLTPDENRKYNRNSQEDYPIILVTDNINQIVAYVKDKTFNFDITPTINNAVGAAIGAVVANQTERPPTVISIPKTAFDSLGNYKIYLVGKNAGIELPPIEFKLSVVDEFFVGVPDIESITYPKELIGGDYVGTDVDFEISYKSRDTDFVKIFVNNSAGFYQEGPNARITLNVQKLLQFSSYTGPNDVIKLNLKLVPYNNSGNKEIVGKEELITVTFRAGDLTIPKELAINRIASAFTSQFDESIFGDESSKYLNHLLHLGDGDSKVVTTWTGSFDSLILKLYEPLPVTVQPNQLVWISKVQSTPIIETISLRGETETACNTLKGPNFSLNPDNGIEFQIYDDLVGSGSVSSVDVINRYASTIGIDTQKLNIEYISGSEYTFGNFINFSSATERVDNFIYKVRLVEYYKNIYFTNTSTASASPYELNEANTSLNKANQLINAMDGFEKYLYYTTNTNSNNLAYPKTNPSSSILINTTSSLVTMWYDELLSQALYFDKYNPNRLTANIPEFLVEDTANEDFITFLNMIGQHFDILWSYISSLAKTKSVEASEYKGISNDVVQFVLESHGWDVKKAFNSNFLWEYAFGTYKDGTQKYSKSLESANEEIWRRILNNLPYILKHKGTGRAMKAVMACYGVPQSMLTIMEFGGPQDPSKGGSTKFTFDDRTAAIYLSGSASVKVPWKFFTGSLDYPNCVEFRFKPASLPNTTSTLISGSEWTLDLVQTTGSFGKLELNFGGDQALTTYMETSGVNYPYFNTSIEYVFGPDYKTGSLDFPISTEYYSNVAINRYNSAGTGSWYEVWLGTSNGDRIITSVSMSIFAPDTQWSSGSHLQIGSNTFTGNVDEVRLWKVPLQRSKFNNHVLFPDATNGNSYTASTEDLLFRLDFEYPKDRNADPYIKNVAINQSYDGANSYATASQMYTATVYPYQYTPYDRTVTAEVPSLGFGYSNKIRFESASLVTDLSYKTRATKKAFDQSPIDSNRLGLFFSPIKELNMDILKTFGDFNIDNYIGDPRDEYKDTYSELETLREYYFERMNQNINEYIQLVRYIDKSLFDVLAELAPARAKVSKGLLIEPHLLERSKTRWKETIAEKNSYDTSISTNDDIALESDFIPKETELNAISNTVLSVERPDYDGTLDAVTVYDLNANPAYYDTLIEYLQDTVISGSVPMYEFSLQIPTGSTLTGEVDSFKFQAIGMERDSLANVGFGLYARNGNAIIPGFDGVFGNYITTHITSSVNGGDRKSVFLVKEQYDTKVSTQTEGWPATNIPGQRVKYENVLVTNNKYKVTVLPFSGSVDVGGSVTEVTAVNGYLPTHYRYVNGLSEGMKRSFWKGSQQNASTTPDGLSPLEIFTTNPNVLKVANTGRGSGEPILIVD